ncbi:hypothetical protein MKK67_19525 [Methylobacterium sp. J-072]|uniref:hypothetical protein n=1 Tax=Methylobacterium sp. J-072 TaxID=2836651 RepID=UPI001FBBBC74|nr:hypothetical protein [Methylobacterium sp. J-072]MCJ2094668.1 hypothetical protein [Methylobacterium sp. J-072]
MVAAPALYVLATPRIDLTEEHAAHLRELAAAHGKTLTIETIHSDQPRNRSGVDRRLRDALARAASPHTIIVTTHAGLLGLERSDIAGWHVCVDEIIDTAIMSGEIGLGASWPALAAFYDLVPSSEDGWYRLAPRKDVQRVGIRQVRGDVGRELVELHRLAASRGRIVEVNIAVWADAGVSKRRVRWRSIWTLAELQGARSVTIAATGYTGSLLDYATRRAGGVHINTVPVGNRRIGQPQIEIRYYTRHSGSTNWWERSEGSACIAAIAQHLSTINFQGYWTANQMAAPYLRHRFAGLEVRPKTAGTNVLREFEECAVVYSCKATPADTALIEALNLDREAVRAAREDEDIFQMVTRGAIRDPEYSGRYEIHVYDDGQAERLRARMLAGGFTDVMLVPVFEAGVMDVKRKSAGRARKSENATINETADERAERLRLAEVERGRRRRTEDQAKKMEAGTYRGRGRPRKVASAHQPSA